MAELPHIVEYFKANGHGDKLKFLSVSLDTEDTKDEIKKVAKDVPWPIVSDWGGWDSQLAALYGIRSIPELMLVGPDGKVLLNGIRTENLGDVDKVIAAGQSFKPLTISVKRVEGAAGLKFAYEVNNPEAAAYEIVAEFRLAKQTADGKTVWDENATVKTFKASANKASGEIDLGKADGIYAFDLTVKVESKFFGRAVGERVRARV